MYCVGAGSEIGTIGPLRYRLLKKKKAGIVAGLVTDDSNYKELPDWHSNYKELRFDIRIIRNTYYKEQSAKSGNFLFLIIRILRYVCMYVCVYICMYVYVFIWSKTEMNHHSPALSKPILFFSPISNIIGISNLAHALSWRVRNWPTVVTQFFSRTSFQWLTSCFKSLPISSTSVESEIVPNYWRVLALYPKFQNATRSQKKKKKKKITRKNTESVAWTTPTQASNAHQKKKNKKKKMKAVNVQTNQHTFSHCHLQKKIYTFHKQNNTSPTYVWLWGLHWQHRQDNRLNDIATNGAKNLHKQTKKITMIQLRVIFQLSDISHHRILLHPFMWSTVSGK